MAVRVPTYDNFTVAPSVLPSAPVAPGISADQAATGAKQLVGIGGAIQQAGGQYADQIADELRMANQLRVDDAMNAAKETALRLTYDPQEGFQNVRGVDALQRQSGKPLAEEYGSLLSDRVKELEAGLGNDAQRRMFRMNANNLVTQFTGQALSHESAQFREYALSVREGTVKNRMNEIGMDYKNPEVVSASVQSIRAATYDQARLLGRSAEWAEAEANKMTSAAHAIAIASAIQNNDPLFADQYLKKHAKEMNADDILRVNGSLNQQMDSHIAAAAVGNVMLDIAPKMAPTDSDRAFNILLGTESRNRQFGPDGKPLTSSAGAIGIAQVMPATAPEAAKLAGLAWDEEKYKTDPEYNRALGKAYFEKQLKDFNGNLAMAYAAYNAGPGRLKEAIDKAKKYDTPMVENYDEQTKSYSSFAAEPTTEQWIKYVPKETQAYVQKNMKEFNAGLGQGTPPSLMEVKNAVREQIGTENPQRLKMALDEAERQYKDMQESIKQTNEAFKAEAMRQVVANGGDYSSLPAELRSKIAPGDVSSVMDFAKKVAAGDDTTNLWLYNKLASDPQFLSGLSEDQFFALRGELSQADFKHFSNERSKVINGTGTTSPGTLPSGINDIVNDRLRMMGLDPTPKDESKDAMRVGAIRRFINDSVLKAQADAGKKFDSAQTSAHIDKLFSTMSDKELKSFAGFRYVGGGEPVLGMTKSDIPTATREAIEATLKARGVEDPTEADILSVYWRSLSMKPQPKGKKTDG